jgi:hypothetical protein
MNMDMNMDMILDMNMESGNRVRYIIQYNQLFYEPFGIDDNACCLSKYHKKNGGMEADDSLITAVFIPIHSINPLFKVE